MNRHENAVDCIYVAASRRDARWTRICVASVRYFYSYVPIKILAGGPLQTGLAGELARYWNAGIAHTSRRRDWGWGFVKMEPLFGPPGERFLVLDSDTVFGGDVLRTRADSAADFIVDDEAQSEIETKRLYYDWRKVSVIDPAAQPPLFVFNTGQWFGTSGVLTRKDFFNLIDWNATPPRLCHPECFMPGDQGVLNYVLNKHFLLDKISVDRRKIMRWPRHTMDGLNIDAVKMRKAPPLIVHWAGIKSNRFSVMPGAELLSFFEDFYYAKVPQRHLRRAFNLCQQILVELMHFAQVRLALAIRVLIN